MASNVNLDMDSKEVAVEIREGSIASNTNDGKATASAEKTASSPPGVVDKKTGKVKDGKKSSSAKHGSKRRHNAKSKKVKKTTSARNVSSSSESGGSETSSSSGESDDSASATEALRANSMSKKRHHGRTKRSTTRSSKKGRKQSSRLAESSDSDSDTQSSGSDTDLSADAADKINLGKARGRKKQKILGMQQKMDMLQRHIQELQLRVAAPAGLSLGNTGPLNGLPAGSGLLGPGGTLNSAALSGLNSIYGSQDQGLGLRRALGGHLTRPPPRGGARARNPDRGHPAGRSGTIRGSGGLDQYYEEDEEDEEDEDDEDYRDGDIDSRRLRQNGRNKRRPQRLDFKRVDQVWDSQIHNYKLQDTAENADDAHYNEYLFHVRRTFDWEGKYKTTIVDIKSKQLREALQDVMGNIKGVSLVEDTPKLDPNVLFLYLEDLREHMHNLKDLEPDAKSSKGRKKVQKWINQKRRHLRVLVKYLDKDYALTKKSLYPLLDNGLITFDLCWALWKPNTLAYTTTYGSVDEPRVFKVDIAEKHHSIIKGDYYYIEGKYFEFDGKQFGYGSMSEEISDFRGARKISSLGCYPLKYHKNEAQLRKDLIDRGKKFVSLAGAHYKSHQGIAYYKKKKSIVKVNINGRIMVDPSTHRRNNPNYPISLVRPKDHDLLSDPEDSDDDEGCCEYDSDDADDGGKALIDSEDRVKYVTKVIKDKNGNIRGVRIPKSEVEDGNGAKLDNVQPEDSEADGGAEGGDKQTGRSDKKKNGEKPCNDTDKNTTPEFAEEEYLIASPVVLGFAFAEKLWLELSVSGVKEILWNESAYDSLVLEPKTKDIVKALVESHKYHAAESIDDVIQGKGKGLVFVLHGPPGTGKTLTAEGISELLKCPLYNVSAGDLGTDSRLLEMELQKVLDICHAWGAILLLDEADVFLEKRNMHDIHRNALVSIFLRQLEYFQGILFLTTNRVETFDDAFQSRIHIALRYDDLDTKAKKAIFKIFIERVRALKEVETEPFTEEDYNKLARHTLNGRQIKNTIRTAQALAVNRGEPLGMRHIAQFLDVLQSFERDLKGGTGYQEAMRSYF